MGGQDCSYGQIGGIPFYMEANMYQRIANALICLSGAHSCSLTPTAPHTLPPTKKGMTAQGEEGHEKTKLLEDTVLRLSASSTLTLTKLRQVFPLKISTEMQKTSDASDAVCADNFQLCHILGIAPIFLQFYVCFSNFLFIIAYFC